MVLENENQLARKSRKRDEDNRDFQIHTIDEQTRIGDDNENDCIHAIGESR
jgi:hypothetical protein